MKESVSGTSGSWKFQSIQKKQSITGGETKVSIQELASHPHIIYVLSSFMMMRWLYSTALSVRGDLTPDIAEDKDFSRDKEQAKEKSIWIG